MKIVWLFTSLTAQERAHVREEGEQSLNRGSWGKSVLFAAKGCGALGTGWKYGDSVWSMPMNKLEALTVWY